MGRMFSPKEARYLGRQIAEGFTSGIQIPLSPEKKESTMSSFTELMNMSGENAKASGWHEGIPDPTITPVDHNNWIAAKLLLVVSEITEALEELRNGNNPEYTYYTEKNGVRKPEGFSVEIADAFIRLFDLYWTLEDQGWLMPDLHDLIEEKLEHNATKRGYRHGGKAL